jgi:hypothetical protein
LLLDSLDVFGRVPAPPESDKSGRQSSTFS